MNSALAPELMQELELRRLLDALQLGDALLNPPLLRVRAGPYLTRLRDRVLQHPLAVALRALALLARPPASRSCWSALLLTFAAHRSPPRSERQYR